MKISKKLYSLILAFVLMFSAVGASELPHTSSIVTLAATQTGTTTANLNMRSGMGTQYSILVTIPNGTTLTITNVQSNWGQTTYAGYTGYVSMDYISLTTSGTGTAVTMSVSKYLQSDSRWNTYVFAPGNTIGGAGCTITCLSMAESYRTGTATTPLDMAKKLTYASDGSLYWPSNYTRDRDASDYINKIYNILYNSRKPVLIGAAKSNGTTHWVLVIGFKGGDKVASNFTINDPAGSATTLQDFLNVYNSTNLGLAYYN